MNELEISLSGYYREIRSWLPCSRKKKDQILTRFRDSVHAYVNENPTANFAQIRSHFGNPDEIAGIYVEEMDTLELLRILRIRRKIVAMVAGVLAAALIIWIGAVAWSICDALTRRNGYIIEEKGYVEQIITTTTEDGP